MFSKKNQKSYNIQNIWIMKKLLIATIAASALLPMAMMAETPQEYLAKFKELVGNAGNASQKSDADYARTDSLYNVYVQEYDGKYKDSMSASQREEYYKLKGQYARVVVERKADGVADRAVNVGNEAKDKTVSVAQQVGDKGRAVGNEAKERGRKVINKVDSVGAEVGRKVSNGVNEGVNYVKGLFEKKK